MVSPVKIEQVRLSLQTRLAELPNEVVKKEFLLGVIDQRVRDTKSRTERALAITLYLRNDFIGDDVELRRRVKTATDDFNILADRGRGYKVYGRKFATVAANCFIRRGDIDTAIRLYRDALDGERDVSSQHLNFLNIARAYLRRGDFYQVLVWVGKTDYHRETRPRLVAAGKLLQVRVFLILGFEKLATSLLQEMRSLNSLDKALELERRYLGLMARFRFTSPKDFMKRFDEFVGYVTDSASKRAQYFYELEGMILRPFLDPKSRPNWKHYLSRGHFLAEKVEAKRHWAMLTAIRDCFKRDAGKNAYFDLNEKLFELAPSNHRLYQLLALLIADRELRKNQIAALQITLSNFNYYMNQIHSGLPEKSLSLLQSDPSEVEKERLRLIAKAPKSKGFSEEFFSPNWLEM